MKRLAITVAGAALLVGLSACGGTQTPENENTPSVTGSESATGQEPEQTPSLDPSSGIDDDGKETGAMTITGTVSSGVESGCVLLEYDGTVYNLVGGDAGILTAGATVEVTGRVDEGLMTTCQQGTPFVVESATAA
ncbi:hypothetical protein LX16_0147 [Stackebrandtia albiflava]|uniref:Uncharacterized protein n=1 Tax=Stackebrandtia albiflava TaxID=406432 RepID=A0A562VG48_9ACTN|nr:hypothetical protein [Stackebrandtia albiflava]TWJ16896.1 hypothetical protein LX16_0147 [Stackebrandtia albiflava]